MVGIYKITSPIGMIYIGKSIDIERRWYQYRTTKAPFQKKLKSSFQNYGVEHHIFEIIEECNECNLTDREAYYINFYDALNQLNCKKAKKVCTVSLQEKSLFW